MNNIVVLPIVIPMLTGILLILLRRRMAWQRSLSMLSLLAIMGSALYLIHQVHHEGIQSLHLGGWIPPFGIVLVADMLAVLLVFITGIVAAACLWFSFRTIGEGRERHFFYPLLQFLLTGVCGSFLTGDLFNLFVFFEVLLISSYALLSLGGTKPQLRESFKYLLINIVSSAFFVAAVAYLYGVTGTLNMAHLSLRVAEMGQDGILTLIALLFMFVFATKAALFLYFWLPESYSVPATAVAALFSALLTKVGIYALIRTFTLIFYHDPGFTHQLLAWLAALTMVLGVVGAIAYHDIRKILAYNIIIAVGFIVFGLAIFTPTSLEGMIYYLLHDMLVKALLFLAGGLIILITAQHQLSRIGGLIKHYPLLGWIFLVTAVALAGIPPFSGFVGKLLIIEGGLEQGFYVFVGVSLLASLFVLYSLVKVFMLAFWKPAPEEEEAEHKPGYKVRSLYAPLAILLLLSLLYGLGSEAWYPYLRQAAETLMDPAIYIQAVLKE